MAMRLIATDVPWPVSVLDTLANHAKLLKGSRHCLGQTGGPKEPRISHGKGYFWGDIFGHFKLASGRYTQPYSQGTASDNTVARYR